MPRETSSRFRAGRGDASLTAAAGARCESVIEESCYRRSATTLHGAVGGSGAYFDDGTRRPGRPVGIHDRYLCCVADRISRRRYRQIGRPYSATVNDLAYGRRLSRFTCRAASCWRKGWRLAWVLERVAREHGTCRARSGCEAIVTGDTKVVERGAADRIFINTVGGVGVPLVPRGTHISADRAQPGDALIVNGSLGDHGVAILLARNQLALEAEIASDSQPLHGLVAAMLAACPVVHCLRDATRGGLATVLSEFAAAPPMSGIRVREAALPINDIVRGACGDSGAGSSAYLAERGGKARRNSASSGGGGGVGGNARPSGRTRVGHCWRSDCRAGGQRDPVYRVRRRSHRRHAGWRTVATDLLMGNLP